MATEQKFINEIVEAHNVYRGKHQAPPIQHAKDLTSYAQKWADHLAATGNFMHSNCNLNGEILGENIAMKWSSKPEAYTGQEVTDQWYSEVKMHTFGGESSSMQTGHFTQVVWKACKAIGVGKASSRDGKTIVVASYRPAGNMMGEYAKNVLPPKDGKISIPVQRDTSNDSNRFASRFEDVRKGCGDTFGVGKGGKETRTTRTTTTNEGGVTKSVIEETITKADGTKVTTTKESVRSDSGCHASGYKELDTFKDLGLSKSKSKSTRKESSSSSSDEEKSNKKPIKLNDFIDEAVKVHNELRSKHGAGRLKHAKDLSEYAQRWAEHIAATESLQHSNCMHNGDRLGENICYKWSSAGADYTGREACEQWYSEISKHNFRSEPRSLDSGRKRRLLFITAKGHFTQMVWKGTKEMGIGKAKTSGGKVFVVASYRPAGNVVGHFVENVSPPIK